MDPQLWAWVDRVIYDSQTWSNFDEQMKLVRQAQEEARQRIVLCDLNWVRLVHLRLALAQFFDHPATHHHLEEIKALEIKYRPGFRSTALLLVGWLAGQLGWENGSREGDSLGFRRPQSGKAGDIRITLQEAEGEPISSCKLRTASAQFHIAQKPGADLLDVSFGRTGGRQMDQLLPAGDSSLVELIKEELMRGGPHRVYLRAVAQVRPLF
jgi:glucose-6-phosphate dehydrogenase assembly protein OpcA